MSRPQLSFALLNYNERGTVEEAARRASRALEACRRTYELVLVDDGSNDGSGDVLRRLARELPHCRTIFHGENRGIGAGIRTCYFQTVGQWATWFPADLQADPEELGRLLDGLDDCDALLTYRRPKGRHVSAARKIVSQTDRLLVRALFGIGVRDLHWIRFFRRDLLQRMAPRLNSPAIDTEMLVAARRLGARIRQEPLDELPRTSGVARGASPSNLLGAATETLMLRLRGPGLQPAASATDQAAAAEQSSWIEGIDARPLQAADKPLSSRT